MSLMMSRCHDDVTQDEGAFSLGTRLFALPTSARKSENSCTTWNGTTVPHSTTLWIPIANAARLSWRSESFGLIGWMEPPTSVNATWMDSCVTFGRRPNSSPTTKMLSPNAPYIGCFTLEGRHT
ncbi:hypothetical protein L6452_05960 [Arctium lappa]|uniref:Uncharacterized protein n=1 Tax=Arctium lappa TaxID=4217 RepID=A0ACB9EHK5_ARCLA|nr:hypothetical protein L6452_05960 [Arctium lappa]